MRTRALSAHSRSRAGSPLSSLLLVLVLAVASTAATSACGPTAKPAPIAVEPTPTEPGVNPMAPDPILIAVEAAVNASDRSPADVALDAGRRPVELLSFLRVAPGMKVAELFAGGGYTSELLARVVGTEGVVYGQNTRKILEMFAEKPWSERLTHPAMAPVVRVDRELDDPLPAEAKGLDLVVAHLVYHDFVWLDVDRAKLNQAIFAALRPGGEYAIIDHSAAVGAGSTVAQTLHRIEPGEIRRDLAAAGFVLDREGDFLHSATDTRDWSTSPGAAGEKRGTSDRFVLVFRKPH